MSAVVGAEAISGAIIRHVLLAGRVPEGLEAIDLGSRRLERRVRAAWGSADELRKALRRAEISEGLTLQLLTLSEPIVGTEYSLDVSALEALRSWASGGGSAMDQPPLLIQLQGVLICVGSDRIGLAGASERIAAVEGATLEYFWLHAEVSGLEQRIDDRWCELDEDTAVAFELSVATLDRREQLRQRFQQMIAAKALLARLAPLIECPVIYPPTLSSQAAERLREKSRLGERLQHLREQLEVFERVYELCGQRMSDFISSRRSHLLEWIIVVLLSFELLLMVIDWLGTLTETQ
ncbi:MAG: hypothetical protein RLZZ436_1340 [Planctomycetota bacterium]